MKLHWKKKNKNRHFICSILKYIIFHRFARSLGTRILVTIEFVQSIYILSSVLRFQPYGKMCEVEMNLSRSILLLASLLVFFDFSSRHWRWGIPYWPPTIRWSWEKALKPVLRVHHLQVGLLVGFEHHRWYILQGKPWPTWMRFRKYGKEYLYEIELRFVLFDVS